MNNKIILTISLMVFAFCTVFVLSLDKSATAIKRVKITNRNIEITHENTEILNDDEHVNLNVSSATINNKDINGQNSTLNISSSGNNLSNEDISFNNSTPESGSQRVNTVSNGNISYKNLDTSELDRALNMAENISNQRTNASKERNYQYKNLDWGTWKSNFVNKILDDSLALHELDKYDEGTWFYYSFDVGSDGSISNINIRSFALSQDDKDLLVRFIKKYQYKSITAFPPNSQRKKAKVSAVMVLSDTTQKSTPNDFNDFERIKLQY